MSHIAEETKRPKPWQWPFSWARDEKFWRDIASMTISGLLVLVVAYFFGVSLGYFKSPGGFEVFRNVAMTLLYAAFFYFYVLVFLMGWLKKWMRSKIANKMLADLPSILLIFSAIPLGQLLIHFANATLDLIERVVAG